MLILASKSVYRRRLLSRLQIPFDVCAPDCDERRLPEEPPSELVIRLARAKAHSVAQHYANALIIGSDQVAALEDRLLGKPGTHEKAVQQLGNASGRKVVFHTGLCLLNTTTTNVQCEDVEFCVYFRTLTTDQIERYLRKEKPYSCAGSIKSEGLGITLIERLAGDDPTALVGLPLIQLTSMLAQEGVALP